MSADCRWFIELEDPESIVQWQRRGILFNPHKWDEMETVYDMIVPSLRDEYSLTLTHFTRMNKNRRCVIDSSVPYDLANASDMQNQWNRDYCRRFYLWLKNHCTRISLLSDTFDIDLIKTWKFEPQKDAILTYKIIGERIAA